jgi:small subunit ribosomal protein S16
MQPSYRIVATDKESPRDGRFLEILGSYNPRTEPATIQFDEERIYHWLRNGAQPSDSVQALFKATGLLDRFERLKKGEAVETLLEEAQAAERSRAVSPKTRAPETPKKGKQKAGA